MSLLRKRQFRKVKAYSPFVKPIKHWTPIHHYMTGVHSNKGSSVHRAVHAQPYFYKSDALILRPPIILRYLVISGPRMKKRGKRMQDRKVCNQCKNNRCPASGGRDSFDLDGPKTQSERFIFERINKRTCGVLCVFMDKLCWKCTDSFFCVCVFIISTHQNETRVVMSYFGELKTCPE